MGESEWADVVGVVELAMNTAVAASMGEAPVNSILESYPTCQSMSRLIVKQLINQLP